MMHINIAYPSIAPTVGQPMGTLFVTCLLLSLVLAQYQYMVY